MGSSAARAVRSYPQLVLCSYNTFFSQSMHTLSHKRMLDIEASLLWKLPVARQKANSPTFHTVFH